MTLTGRGKIRKRASAKKLDSKSLAAMDSWNAGLASFETMGGGVDTEDTDSEESKSLIVHPLEWILDSIKEAQYEMLFGLLQVQKSRNGKGSGLDDLSISEMVWDILQMLPTNPVILDRLRKLAPVKFRDPSDWRALLNWDSTLQLLYHLQIVDAFMKSGGVGAESDKEEVRCRTTFCVELVQFGGVEHLVTILRKGKFAAAFDSTGSRRESYCLTGRLVPLDILKLTTKYTTLDRTTPLVPSSTIRGHSQRNQHGSELLWGSDETYGSP